MDRPLLVYTTFPDRATGLAIGETLVREKLAACVNLVPGMESVYAWNGAIERGSEVVGLIKTRSGLKQALATALRTHHPYDTPIVLAIEAEADAATLTWILTETGAGPSP